jgi:hypothetical protein
MSEISAGDESFLAQQIQNDARIDMAGPIAHHQPVERREAHGGGL